MKQLYFPILQLDFLILCTFLCVGSLFATALRVNGVIQQETQSLSGTFEALERGDSAGRNMAEKELLSFIQQVPRIQPNTLEEEVLPVVFARLDSQNATVRHAAVGILFAIVNAWQNDVEAGAISQKHEILGEILSHLKDALEDASPAVKLLALMAISYFEDQLGSVKGRLLELLHDPDPEVRKAAVGVISKMRPLPEDVVAKFLDILETERDMSVWGFTARTLGSVEPPTDEIISTLIDGLSHLEPSIRSSAASALRTIGPPAEEAVPALERIANDPDENEIVRKAASSALRSIRGN